MYQCVYREQWESRFLWDPAFHKAKAVISHWRILCFGLELDPSPPWLTLAIPSCCSNRILSLQFYFCHYPRPLTQRRRLWRLAPFHICRAPSGTFIHSLCVRSQLHLLRWLPSVSETHLASALTVLPPPPPPRGVICRELPGVRSCHNHNQDADVFVLPDVRWYTLLQTF